MPRYTDGQRQVWTVGEFVNTSRDLLADAMPFVWVRGEVQRFPTDASRRKHIYFELHDTSAITEHR